MEAVRGCVWIFSGIAHDRLRPVQEFGSLLLRYNFFYQNHSRSRKGNQTKKKTSLTKVS